MLRNVRLHILAGGIALLASAAPIAGCGSNVKTAATRAVSTPTSATSTTTSSRTAPAAVRPPTRAQALAFAARVQLRASDLPAFTAERGPASHTPVGGRVRAEFLGCLGAPPPRKHLAHSRSPTFESSTGNEQQEIFTATRVWRNQALAARQLAAAESANVRTCLSHALSTYLRLRAGGQVSFGKITVLAATPTAPGMSGAFGWTLTIPVNVHGIGVSVNASILGFQDGQGEVVMAAMGEPEPVGSTVQQRLFSRLLQRAKASRL